MVAAVDPYRTAIDENINVLRFTSLARQIKTNYTLPHSPSILTPSAEAPHYSLPTRSGRSHAGPTLSKIVDSPKHQALINSAEQQEDDYADQSLVSFVNENDLIDDDASEGSMEDDPLVAELFEEIRQLKQEAVQRDYEFELELHRIRQEERDRYNAQLEEQRQQMLADAQYQVSSLPSLLIRDLASRAVDLLH